jgi:putative peptidoglycan lipid II flippase
MVSKIIEKGRKIFTSQQTSVLSAATLIMLMIITSRVLGLARQRILAHFFTVDQLSLFFAAFRLPDSIFEVLVFGTFSSAFIPVFARVARKNEKEAWVLASSIVNIGVVIFAVMVFFFFLSAKTFYGIIAPGFSPDQQVKIVFLTRILFLAQGFFVISYVLTGVLESLKRFLIPALAPIFYNLGIILGTIVLVPYFGLMAPVYGVVFGAFLHFAIQIPLAYRLGFSFRSKISFDTNSFYCFIYFLYIWQFPTTSSGWAFWYINRQGGSSYACPGGG